MKSKKNKYSGIGVGKRDSTRSRATRTDVPTDSTASSGNESDDSSVAEIKRVVSGGREKHNDDNTEGVAASEDESEEGGGGREMYSEGESEGESKGESDSDDEDENRAVGIKNSGPQSEVCKNLQQSYNHVVISLKNFVEGKLFPHLKFLEKGDALMIFRQFQKDAEEDCRGKKVSVGMWECHCRGKVSKMFKNLRHKTRTGFSSRYRGLMKQGRLPADFPEGILAEKAGYDSTSKGKCQKYEIHPQYRKNKEAFELFATNFLPLVNNTFNKEKTRKGKKLISEVFTISDEAFAIFMLINDLPGMVWRGRGKKEDEEEHSKKPFTDGASGDHSGWNDVGREMYAQIYEKVRELRKTQVSKELEKRLLEQISPNKKVNKRKRAEDEERTRLDIRMRTLEKDNPFYAALVGCASEKSDISKYKPRKEKKMGKDRTKKKRNN